MNIHPAKIPGTRKRFSSSGVSYGWLRSLLATAFVDEFGRQRPVDGFADRHEF